MVALILLLTFLYYPSLVNTYPTSYYWVSCLGKGKVTLRKGSKVIDILSQSGQRISDLY